MLLCGACVHRVCSNGAAGIVADITCLDITRGGFPVGNTARSIVRGDGRIDLSSASAELFLVETRLRSRCGWELIVVACGRMKRNRNTMGQTDTAHQAAFTDGHHLAH